MALVVNSLNSIQKIKFDNLNHMLGKGLLQPFSPSNSGSRKLMHATQRDQAMGLCNPEIPYVGTGFEMEYGRKSSSYITIPNKVRVIGKISKFSNAPNHHYYLIVLDEDKRNISVIERKSANHITQSYGYLYNNSTVDKYNINDTIEADTAVLKSMAFDNYGNRQDGVNLLTMYGSCEDTMEDAIVISETASKKLAAPLVKKVSIMINDNDIPLNIYGDMDTYKIFPDIGEETKDSIVCALRREKKDESLFSQAYNRLRETFISDDKIRASGKVVDINVYCNDPERLNEFQYNSQLKYYYDENMRMSIEIVNLLQPYLASGYTMDYDLQRLHSTCSRCIQGVPYFSERKFSNIYLEITLVEEILMLKGDKLSNRYGGKGVVATVRPDALMPRTKDGKVIELILNMCGVYGRENAGQLFEITTTFVAMNIVKNAFTRPHFDAYDVSDYVETFLDFIRIISPTMADYYETLLDNYTDDEVLDFISGVYDDGGDCLYMAIEPMTENMTLDKVDEMYQRFSWIQPENLMMPVVDSLGKIRYVESRRPMIYGYQYMIRLKQYAEEKFSVTSLSATNARNENTKSKSSNMYRSLYARTPVRLGDMETGNMIHLGAELVVQMLMLYSTSPHARRLTEEMLTGDAFNIDVNLDMESRNRNAEILNVYLKTMGLKLEFIRKPKKYNPGLSINPMVFYRAPQEPIQPMIFYNKDEVLNSEKSVQRLLDQGDLVWGMDIYPMEFEDRDEEDNK